jgi:hypothetical protein
MPSSPTTVADLRSLLAARFPERPRAAAGTIPTEIRGLDEALGGGLPAARLIEIVSAAPSTGGQTLIAQILRATRRARQRIALIDGADGFDAGEVPEDHLRHLVWVRGRGQADAFAAADILLRDGNYAVVVLDTRGLSERALLRTPTTTWHRLRHATEAGASAALVLSTTPLVPTVPWRFVLQAPISLASRRTPRSAIADGLTFEVSRGRTETERKSA